MKLLILLSLCAVAWGELTQSEKYRGKKLFATTPETKEQVLGLRELEEEIHELNFVAEASRPGFEVLVVVPDEFQEIVSAKMDSMGLKYQVQVDDMETYMEQYWEQIWAQKAGKAYDINTWNTYEDIMTELEAMKARCPAPLTCETYVAGQSYEGRDLKVLTIKSGSNKQIIWMDSLIHAREWLAGTTVLKIMDTLTRDYNNDATVKRLIDNFDWYFLPVMNPDGYTYTWDLLGDRMWRKSRNPNAGSTCFGTDLNRNYDYFWNTGGSSGSACSSTYRGSAAASEPETKVVQAQADLIASSAIAFVTVHTAANMVLMPYGFAVGGVCERPDDHDDLQAVADLMCFAIEGRHDTLWQCGNGCEILYSTSGTTLDYAKGAGIKYSYTPELRGPGFDPGAANIQPGFEEFYDGVIAMADAIATRK